MAKGMEMELCFMTTPALMRDRGKMITSMAKAFRNFLTSAYTKGTT